MMQDQPQSAGTGRRWKLAGCCAGILVCFLLYGITQEKIMTTSYGTRSPSPFIGSMPGNVGPSGERFRDTAFLVTVNRFVAILIALLALRSQNQPLRAVAPFHFYLLIAACNFLATFCQYEALKYVTFPTQTLGKCAKMIPVLVLGALLQKKQYTWREFLAAGLVTVGCTLFLSTGAVSTAAKKGAEYDTPWGLVLILLYLGFDGLTSTTQERLFRNFQNMSTFNQMLYVNACSAVFGLLALMVPNPWSSTDTSFRILPALHFAMDYPQFLLDALLLSACSSLGQLVIYYTIKEFGALIYSTIMTTRQFLGILLSALLFSHPITLSQWMGATLVFAALYWRAFNKSATSGDRHSAALKRKKSLDEEAALRSGDVFVELDRSIQQRMSMDVPGTLESHHHQVIQMR